MTGKIRSAWAEGDPVMAAYHDTGWGVPLKDDSALWEMLMLGGFQAGLSWRTVLHRRAGFRVAFDGFVPERVAAFDEGRIEMLMSDTGIIRARAKIVATVGNARAYLAMQEIGESFSGLPGIRWAGSRSLATGSTCARARLSHMRCLWR